MEKEGEHWVVRKSVCTSYLCKEQMYLGQI